MVLTATQQALLDLRLQNLVIAIGLAFACEGAANVAPQKMKETDTIIARVCNILTVIQMLFFVMYVEVDIFAALGRSSFYVIAQIAAVLSDSGLFYLMYKSAVSLNLNNNQRMGLFSFWLLLLSVLIEIIYKTLACLYYVTGIYNTADAQVYKTPFEYCKGIQAIMFVVFASIHLVLIVSHLWPQRQSPLFVTLVGRAGKAVFVIAFFAIGMFVAAIPPLSLIPNIVQNVTNPLQMCMKSSICLLFLIKVNDEYKLNGTTKNSVISGGIEGIVVNGILALGQSTHHKSKKKDSIAPPINKPASSP